MASVAIIVSNLPKQLLLQELKDLMIDHFSNFGPILRISCATKGKLDRIAHIQFSSTNEAHQAKENGKICRGHVLAITITDKLPTTKLSPFGIRPSSSYVPPQTIQPTWSVRANDVRQQAGPSCSYTQATIDEFIGFNSASRTPGTSNPEPRSGAGQNVDDKRGITRPSYQTGVDRKPVLPDVLNIKPEKKPLVNSCGQLEVYQGPPPRTTAPMARSQSTSRLNTVATADFLRPARSLSEIMNLDVSTMKVVKVPSASDALACQYFSGGKFPFSLPMMFGRPPGNVIMPTNIIMEAIKPGMGINDLTLERIWNTVLQSVLNRELPMIAKEAHREEMIDGISQGFYCHLEESLLISEIEESATRETGYEEDVWIICEDLMEAVMGLVITEEIKTIANEEIRPRRIMSKLLECCFRKMVGIVLKETVKELIPDIMKDALCEEVVEDILDSLCFKLHVKVVAQEALRQCKEDCFTPKIESSDISPSGSSVPNLDTRGSLSKSVPREDPFDFMEHWFKTSSFDIHEDSFYTDVPELPSSLDSDTDSSKTSTKSQEKSACSILMVNERPVDVIMVTPSNQKGKKVVNSKKTDERSGNKFFASLKRKAAALFTVVSPDRFLRNKKPKKDPQISVV